MASIPPFLSLLLLLFLHFTTAASISTVNSTSIAPTPSPLPVLPPSPLYHQGQGQFNTIIDVLINAGDFENWANLLAEADPSIIPFSATLFVPDDDAFLDAMDSAALNFIDPLLIPYHVVPLRIPFAALRLFPAGGRLPTLLPEFSLLVTNHSAENFTINGCPISRPDLYLDALVSVHGVGAALDYTLYGRDSPPPPPPPSQLEFDDGEVDIDEYTKIPAVFQIMNDAVSLNYVRIVVSLLAIFWIPRNGV